MDAAGAAAWVAPWVFPAAGLLANTAAFGVATATLATALGWAMAHAHARFDYRGRRLLHALWLAPLLMPSFTFAMALVVLLGHNGVLARLSGWHGAAVYGPVGLTVAGVLARLPYAYLGMLLAYRGIDERSLEAAADLGASPRLVLRRVLIPRLTPALATVFAMVLADTVADLANPLVVGGGFDVLASRLYEAVKAEGDYAAAGAYAVLLMVPAVMAVVAGGLLHGGRSPAEAPLPPRPASPAGPGRLLVILGWAVGGLVVLLLGAIGAASVGIVVEGGAGLAAYRELVVGRQAVTLASSVLLACLALPCVVGLSAALALAAAARPARLRRAERVLEWGVAVPSVVLGLAAFLAFEAATSRLGPPGPVVAGLAFAGVVVVHTLRDVPRVALGALRALAAVGPDLRDAARALGAGGPRAWRALELPAMRPALIAGSLTTFARSLTAMSSVVLLADTHVPLLTVRMLVDIDAGRLASAAAMTVTAGGLIAGAALILQGLGQAWRPATRSRARERVTA